MEKSSFQEIIDEDFSSDSIKEVLSPERYSKKEKDQIVVAVCLSAVLANSAYSSIAPFYPAEAAQKGVEPQVVGIIFSGYSLAMFLLSPAAAFLLNNYGRKRVLMAGCFFEVRFALFQGYCYAHIWLHLPHAGHQGLRRHELCLQVHRGLRQLLSQLSHLSPNLLRLRAEHELHDWLITSFQWSRYD